MRNTWSQALAAIAIAVAMSVATAHAQDAAGKADLDSQPPGQGQGATTENPPDASADVQAQTGATTTPEPSDPAQPQPPDQQQQADQQQRQQQADERRDRQTEENATRNRDDQQSQAQHERRSALGITLMESQEGVRVRSVAPNSPAQQAGLERGDLIRSAGGKEFNSAQELARHISSMKAGSELKLAIERDGEPRDITATLAEADAVAFRDQSARQGQRFQGQQYRVMRPQTEGAQGSGDLRQELQQLRREVKELRELVMRFHGDEAGQQNQQTGQPQQ